MRDRHSGADGPGGPRDPDGPPPLRLMGSEQLIARRHEAKRRLRRRRILFGALMPVVLIVLWFGISYVLYMTQPTSMNFTERTAEWVRNDVPFGNQIIDSAEAAVYKAPRRGGPNLKHLREVGIAAAAPTHHSARLSSYTPPPIPLVFHDKLPGEGQWHRVGPLVNGAPPVLVATYRPSTTYPDIVAYALWVDHTRTDTAYYPGRYEPPSAVGRGPMMVPVDQRPRLLATFNGGFTHVDTNNGSAVDGYTNEPLIDGNATLVGYKSGRVNIVKWSGGPDVTPDIAWARQSLTPILYDGKLNPLLNTDPNSVAWGYTLGGRLYTPRTGVGVDRHGNMIFVVVSQATVISLAEVLQHLGAVRGMEYDINPEWHTLITYSHQGGQGGLGATMVEPQDQQSPERYLTPDDRDFMAVYTKAPGPVTVPFK